MKKILFGILIALFALNLEAEASQMQGGEITYRCVGNNNFIFRVTIYRDCSGVAFNNTLINVANNAFLPAIICTLQSVDEVTPICMPVGSQQVAGCGAVGVPFSLAGTQRYIFESQPVSIVVPMPSDGFSFHTTLPCCRNNAQNIASPSLFLRTKMYVDGSFCDSSPVFAQNHPGFVFNDQNLRVLKNYAIDSNQDSLVYEFAYPQSGFNINLIFISPNTVTNPFPGIIPNPDSSRINASNGDVRYVATAIGNWQSCVVVKSYRNGMLFSEVFRDIQIKVLNAPSGINNQAPVLTSNYPICNPNDTNTIEVFAGDTLDFSIFATDTNQGQIVKIYAYSDIFGQANNSLTIGCINPPCAQMFGYPGTPQEFIPPTALVERNYIIGYGYSGVNGAGFRVNWKTSCANVQNNAPFDTYLNVVAQDDQCPLNGIVYKTIRIRVLPKPKFKPAIIECVSINNHGYVELLISNVDSTVYRIDSCDYPNNPALAYSSSFNRRISTFTGHEIYRSYSPNGPYTLIKSLNSLMNQNSLTTIVDSTLFGNFTRIFYYVKTKSGCSANSVNDNSDTITNIYIEAVNSGNNLNLSWNQMELVANTIPLYLVDSAYQVNGLYSLTANGFHSTNTLNYQSYIQGNLDTLVLRVRTENQDAGCTSLSNISKILINTAVGTKNVHLKTLNIFPNPSDGIVQIEVENKGTITLNVHNMLGQLVKTVIITQNITNLNLSELPSGAYFVTADGFETKRFVKF